MQLRAIIRNGLIETPADIYSKLQADAVRLKHSHDAFDLFDFTVTAWHLIEWIDGHKKELGESGYESDLTALKSNIYIKICHDVCTEGKHRKITRYKPVVTGKRNTNIISGGFGAAPFGSEMFGGASVGRRTLRIEVDGKYYLLSDIVEQVLSLYADFDRRHTI